MKKMYKVLATTTILAMAAMPLAASAQSVPQPQPKTSLVETILNKVVKTIPGTMGQITDFVNDETGKFITVTGRGLNPTDQSEIILSISNHTKIIDSKGKRVALKTIMDEGKVVKAFYKPSITKSIPAIGTALTLVVQEQSFSAVDGTVSEVTDTGIVVTGKNIYSGFEDTIVLHYADKVQILGQDGNAVKASDIQPGMSVKAFYGPAVTMSIPPQSTTNYIVVGTTVNEPVQETAPGTDGIVTSVDNNKITVYGSPMEQGGVNHVILSVDKDTQIVNEEGQTLTQDALKADVRVDAYYGEVMTAIYPAQTHADKIVVKAAATNKIEGTIVRSTDLDKGQVYVNVGSDQNRNNDVILNITDETAIVPNTELTDGMKIVAYHSSVMTRSLPGITNAELVIVPDTAVIPY